MSDSPTPLDFTLSVHARSGQTLVAPKMTIQPQAKLPIDMAALLRSLGADATGDFAEGSVSLNFVGTIMPLVGQMTITNPALGLVHEAEMVENDPGRTDIPAMLNGVWWNISGGRDAQVMVTNMSSLRASADVYLDYAGERHSSAGLTFNPHETKTVSVIQMLAALNTTPSQAPEGGITIIQRELQPTLIAQGKILDPVTGFSTTISFPDPARESANSLHATGVPIGTPTQDSPFANTGYFVPHVVVRNLTGVAQTVTVTVEYPQGTTWNSAEGPGGNSIPAVRFTGILQKGQKNPNDALDHPPNPDPATLSGQLVLAPLTVEPYSTLDYSLDSAFGQLPSAVPYCSIRIQYSGAPGSAIAQVSSVEMKSDMVIDAAVGNEGDVWRGSGANPWHLDSQTESIVFLTDASDKPARIGFSVTAGGVHYYLTTLKLAPHETRAIDIRKLRDAQQADFKKNLIPADATDGSVSWIRLDKVAVSGRLIVMQRHKGIASSYDCCFCPCPSSYQGLELDPGQFPLYIQQILLMDAQGQYEDCNNNKSWYDLTDSSTWSSSNGYVAGVNTTGNVTGYAGGSATIASAYSDCDYYDPGCDCTMTPSSSNSICDVVTLTCGTSSGQQGAVSRGNTVICSVNNYGNASISNWKFTDGQTGQVTVTSSSGSTPWSGAAVQSGTVSVSVSGISNPLTAALTVSSRSGWAFTAVQPAKESNGSGTGACAAGLPVLVSPPNGSGDIGKSCLGLEVSWQGSSVSGGPNNGYWYTTSASSTNSTTGLATVYEWEQVPDLDNTSSTFYTKQTGTYNAQTDSNGCILGSNLATQTQRHEIGLAQSNYIESHWGEYQAALNNASNNFGTIIEASVGPPSDTQTTFQNGVNTSLNNAQAAIFAAFSAEPYDVNYTEYYVFLGYVNYAPLYNSCQ